MCYLLPGVFSLPFSHQWECTLTVISGMKTSTSLNSVHGSSHSRFRSYYLASLIVYRLLLQEKKTKFSPATHKLLRKSIPSALSRWRIWLKKQDIKRTYMLSFFYLAIYLTLSHKDCFYFLCFIEMIENNHCIS